MGNQLELLDKHGLASPRVQKVEGREYLSNGKRYIDFCSTSYLGWDFHPALMARGQELAKEWGVLSSWSRLEADPEIYPALEKRICELVGAPKCILGHTITLTNFSLLPVIAQKGTVIADKKVHAVVYEACRLARDHGAKLFSFRHQDIGHLEELLKEHQNNGPVVVAMDGVDSISTWKAPVRELQALVKKYNAWLYLDDAHGFGVFGAGHDQTNPHGKLGGGIVRYWGGDYARTFYVSSFGKAFCTHTAFATIPTEFTEDVPSQFLSNIYSAPPSPFLIGCADAVLTLNATEGEVARAKIRTLTQQLIDGLTSIGMKSTNAGLHPVVFVEVGDLDRLIDFAKYLVASGILGGLRAFPVVPKDRCGVRFAITALNKPEHITRLVEVFDQYRKK